MSLPNYDEMVRNAQAQKAGLPPYSSPYSSTQPIKPPTKDKTMTLKLNMGWIVFLAYLLGGFGSFGYVWNHTQGLDRCYVDNGVQHDCFTDNNTRTATAFMAGLAWPIYWGGVVALNTTK